MTDQPKLMRKALTKFQFAQLVLEQQGLCGCGCGDKLVFQRGQIRDEHLHQISMGGTNEMKNRSLWNLPCTKPKDKRDGLVRKKDRSLNKTTKKSQKPKQKIASHVNGLQNRGFQKKGERYDNTKYLD